MEDPAFLTYVLLFILALVAGTIDAMAGGGGLLNIPGLMATGLDAVPAMATNKFQGVFGTAAAAYRFWREGKLVLKQCLAGAALAFFGSVLGAYAVTQVAPDNLKLFIPFLLMAIAFWVLLSPRLGDVDARPRLSLRAYTVLFTPLIGFYDGFLGPGAGSFFALSMVFFLGLKLDIATARAKFFNFMSNLGPLLFFLFAGKIVWPFALVMTAGNIIGGNLGARLVITYGTSLIRPLLVLTSLAMSIKLLHQQGVFEKVGLLH